MWVFKVLAILALCNQLLSAPPETDDHVDDQDDMKQLDTNSTEVDHDLEGMKEDEDLTTLDTAAEPDMNYDYGEIKGDDEAEMDDDGGSDKDDDDDDDVTGETQLPIRQRYLRRRFEQSLRVAFTVTRALSSTRRAPSTVRFRYLLVNYGRTWSDRRTSFIAPVDGRYFFTFNAVGAGDAGFALGLQRNGKTQFTAYSTGSRGHAGNSGTLKLRRRDRISLRLLRGSIFEPSGNASFTTFSGFKLHVPTLLERLFLL